MKPLQVPAIFAFILLHLIVCTQNAYSQVHSPKYEVRAVWIATVMGLDWPKSTDPVEQERILREIVRNVYEANFNTIYFQVRGRADAMYRSGFEPWSHVLTGVLGQDPGFDPLQCVIDEAHKYGMEVHAWFNTFLVKSGGPLPEVSEPKHVLLTHPEWIRQVNGEWWFDPGIPEVRMYNIKVALDIIKHYNLDGFQLDFIRYPGKNFPDDQSYQSYGESMRRDDWRRENINLFISTLYDSAKAIKPFLKIGATPMGIYKNFNGVRGQSSYDELYQDSHLWLQKGFVDYVVPQVYWTLGDQKGDPDFALVAHNWSDNTKSRHVYLGIAAYKSDVSEQIPLIIDTTRALNLKGNAFFRYTHIKQLKNFDGRYDHKALVPPMPWKDSIPPLPPYYVDVQNITDGIFKIQWKEAQPVTPDDSAEQFLIYRSPHAPIDITNPDNLIARVAKGKNEYIDTIFHISSTHYIYAVTAIDALNNESFPANESIILPEIVEIAKKWEYKFHLGMVIKSSSSVVHIPYEVDENGPVIIKILDGMNREVKNVVDKIQPPGRYVVSTDMSSLGDGKYTCLLLTRNKSERKVFWVD